ncbi:hypothetical protein HY405_01880 [Candidatus Microgenomates bacterium]|nr:hypothetical protein [Candidatus Microgenomates bacterium]
MEPHEKVYRRKRDIILHNFLGGIAWGLGASVGLSIVLAIFGFFFSRIDLIPIVGDFISQVAVYISNSRPNLVQ